VQEFAERYFTEVLQKHRKNPHSAGGLHLHRMHIGKINVWVLYKSHGRWPINAQYLNGNR
jgi:hypothetical protein